MYTLSSIWWLRSCDVISIEAVGPAKQLPSGLHVACLLLHKIYIVVTPGLLRSSLADFGSHDKMVDPVSIDTLQFVSRRKHKIRFASFKTK